MSSFTRAATMALYNRATRRALRGMALIHPREYAAVRARARALHPGSGPGISTARNNYVVKHIRATFKYQWGRVYANALDIEKAEVGWEDGRKNNGRRPVDRPALQYECPKCGAGVRQPCRKPGGVATGDHADRRQLVQEDAA